MRPVSDAFLRTLRGGHQAIFRATVCETFQTGTTPTGTRIPILAGDVNLDATASIRSTADLTTDGTSVAWPRRADDLLAPYGNELYIERGVKYSDDLVEYVGLGYHRIEEPDQDQAPDGPIRISARDRMAGIIDALLTEPRQYGTTASLAFIVTDLVTGVYPDATIEWDDDTGDDILTRSVIVESDRYRFLDDLVKAQGKIWYWDHRGVLVIKTPPSPASPVYDVDSGPGGVLLQLSRWLSRTGVYNAVVASGEGADTGYVARGIAYDDNPDSPTYFSGRFGPVPRFFSSPMLLSDAQARAAAESLLRETLGLPYTLDLALSPNPALEPGDPIRVRGPGRDGVETHVIESLTIPLTADQDMAATTREQTVVLIGSS